MKLCGGSRISTLTDSLCSVRTNAVLGGCCFYKLHNRRAIDATWFSIAFDDYLWGGPTPEQRDLLSSPKVAIDAFTNIFFKKVAIARAPLYQIYATKIAD